MLACVAVECTVIRLHRSVLLSTDYDLKNTHMIKIVHPDTFWSQLFQESHVCLCGPGYILELTISFSLQ